MHVRVVAGPQPLDEVQHVVVAPHPRREAPEVRQGGVRVAVARETHHVAIHPIRVGPIALDRNRGEATLLDQAPGDAGALSVELVRPVRGLADEDEAPVTDEVEQRVVVVGVPGHRMCSMEDGLRCRIGRRRRHRTILRTRAPRSPGPEVPMTDVRAVGRVQTVGADVVFMATVVSWRRGRASEPGSARAPAGVGRRAPPPSSRRATWSRGGRGGTRRTR